MKLRMTTVRDVFMRSLAEVRWRMLAGIAFGYWLWASGWWEEWLR
jgi:hypothetical protein